jgi:hypothetical protein
MSTNGMNIRFTHFENENFTFLRVNTQQLFNQDQKDFFSFLSLERSLFCISSSTVHNMSMNIASGRCKFWNFTNSAIGMSVRQEKIFCSRFCDLFEHVEKFRSWFRFAF